MKKLITAISLMLFISFSAHILAAAAIFVVNKNSSVNVVDSDDQIINHVDSIFPPLTIVEKDSGNVLYTLMDSGMPCIRQLDTPDPFANIAWFLNVYKGKGTEGPVFTKVCSTLRYFNTHTWLYIDHGGVVFLRSNGRSILEPDKFEWLNGTKPGSMNISFHLR